VIDGSTGTITGTTTVAGSYSVEVTASENRGGSSTATFTWTVNANTQPTIVDPGAQTHIVSDDVSIQISATDVDNDVLSYAATGLPNGLVINSETGAITGTAITAGSFNVIVTASENRGGSISASFTWTVNANTQPTIVDPGIQTNIVSDVISLPISATDADNDVLSYAATGLPDGLAIDSATGAIAGIATTAGSYNVVVTASENRGGNVTASFTWTVNANAQPTIVDPGGQTNDVGNVVSLTLSAADANNDVLSYTATGLPDGLAIDSATGSITGTATTAGSFNVVILGRLVSIHNQQ